MISKQFSCVRHLFCFYLIIGIRFTCCHVLIASCGCRLVVKIHLAHISTSEIYVNADVNPGSAFIKPDQRNPWIKDQIKITLLSTISHLLLPNFVSCGRACPSHMPQNLVTVGAKLWTADRFIVDP